jgi:hypothetical protein
MKVKKKDKLLDKILPPSGDAPLSWDVAIKDTEVAIAGMTDQLAGLRAALKVFRERRDAGAPWPGPGAASPKEATH